MKIIKIGEPKVIMSNTKSLHNYFAWPTAARLQNGKIAVVASGFRLRHICPFGKTIISYSDDEGKSYTPPAPVIDTVLDDRDGGILPFGKSNVLVSSFNNSVNFQKSLHTADDYCFSYLDKITEEQEKDALGINFRISNDFGVTFGEYFKSPVSSPHGPLELNDGTILWVGALYDFCNMHKRGVCTVQAHKINMDGTTEFVGEIENFDVDGKPVYSCEPHAIALKDGTIICHIRAENDAEGVFSIFQSESKDNGKTWSKPHQILEKNGGAPPHLFMHSSGLLICTYGYRHKSPYGIRAMLSFDNGKTWDTHHIIHENPVNADLGYPSTIELKDGSLLTVFYTRPDGGPAVIMQQRWKFEK